MITLNVQWFSSIVRLTTYYCVQWKWSLSISLKTVTMSPPRIIKPLIPSGYGMYCAISFNIKHDRRCMYNVEFLRVRLNIFAMET
jgi:hypothetical protein